MPLIGHTSPVRQARDIGASPPRNHSSHHIKYHQPAQGRDRVLLGACAEYRIKQGPSSQANAAMHAMDRDQYGLEAIVRCLESKGAKAVVSAAADAIRALCINNDANKAAIREAWGIPLLVKLLGPEVRTCGPLGMLLLACPGLSRLSVVIQLHNIWSGKSRLVSLVASRAFWWMRRRQCMPLLYPVSYAL